MLATSSHFEPRESELIDALSAGVVATTNAGEITAVNVAASRIFGADRGALVGCNVAQFIAPIADMALAGRGEIKARREPNKVYGYSVSRYVDPTGAPGYAILFQEISNVLELRTQRDRLLQMAALGDALPCILHELKNPLAALSTMLEVMIEDPQPVTPEDIHALLTEVRRIHLTLQGVGGFASPLLTGRHEAIDHAVQEACRILEPTAARRGITLVSLGRALPLLPIDRNVVSGVVFNLVRNAIDACGKGHRIEVDARLDEDGAVFVLHVRDDGPGMTPEVAARCTDLFFTNKPTGSGIGLALCKQVATASGGTLDVTSNLGAGTEVVLRLPVTKAGRRSG
ncbi:MAG: hypothetical protein IPG50_36125 [Myxococcales bacterium]|nr:hypothetical protein [Myxococcales bacterium]